MTHATESTHWYTRGGEPAYTVKAKAGHDRPTTLADARKMALVPSVTTIIKCAAAPGLEIWKQNQVMLAAMTLPKRQDEPEADYIRRIMEDSREQARKAAERGTAIHAAIQGYFERGSAPEEMLPHCIGTMEALIEWGTEPDPIAEASFAHPLGFGGKVDLHGKPNFVCDFKTKEFDTFNGLKTWDEHCMQLAAYRMGLGMPKARCAIVYVSTTVPGLAKLIEIPEEDLARGWTCFYSLLHFWQAKNTYRSSFEAMAA